MFLQGQFTNDLQHAVGSATYGLWLNQKGKVLADSFVLRTGAAEFYVVSVSSPAGQIRERLDAYIIADDVVIEDLTADMSGVSLLGVDSQAMIQRMAGCAPKVAHFESVEGMWMFAAPAGTGRVQFEVIGPSDAVSTFSEKIAASGAKKLSPEEVAATRIEAAIPAIPQDIGIADLPNEGGLETSAISYTKGCYLGQEVMARLKNLGQVRRKLHVVSGSGEAPALATALYQGPERVGEVRSSASRGAGFVAMAMLSLVKFNPKAGLSLAPGSAPTVEVVQYG